MASFGPDHAPLEQRQVALAIEEAQQLVPKPRVIVFAAFSSIQSPPRTSTNWPGVTLLKAQMNADLLTEDLDKSSPREGPHANESSSYRQLANDATRRAYEETPTNSFVIEAYVKSFLESAGFIRTSSCALHKALGILFPMSSRKT